jgi:hypothetical protein
MFRECKAEGDPHLVARKLGHRGLERSAFHDGVDHLSQTVDAHQRDVPARRFDRRERTERAAIIDAENAGEIGVRLYHVFRDRKCDAAFLFSILGRDHLDARVFRNRLLEAAHSLENRHDWNPVEDRHLTFPVKHFA